MNHHSTFSLTTALSRDARLHDESRYHLFTLSLTHARGHAGVCERDTAGPHL